MENLPQTIGTSTGYRASGVKGHTRPGRSRTLPDRNQRDKQGCQKQPRKIPG